MASADRPPRPSRRSRRTRPPTPARRPRAARRQPRSSARPTRPRRGPPRLPRRGRPRLRRLPGKPRRPYARQGRRRRPQLLARGTPVTAGRLGRTPKALSRTGAAYSPDAHRRLLVVRRHPQTLPRPERGSRPGLRGHRREGERDIVPGMRRSKPRTQIVTSQAWSTAQGRRPPEGKDRRSDALNARTWRRQAGAGSDRRRGAVHLPVQCRTPMRQAFDRTSGD